MKKRELGNSGLKVPPLALGGNVFGWTADVEKSGELLDAALEHGLTFIDTADVYSSWAPGNHGGESERIIGKWLDRTGNREKFVIATKVGKLGGREGLRKKNILQAAEESLERLRVDVIDLYFAHAQDVETPIEETLEAFAQLIADGKVKAIGASNYDAPHLIEALEISAKKSLPRYEVLQPNYNLYDREGYESELQGVALENGLGVVPYYALAQGFLAGKYRKPEDFEAGVRGPRAKKYLTERGRQILKALDEAAGEYASTPAAVSLAWLMAKPSITAPIASATSVAHIRDLAAAVALELGDDAMKTLDKASAGSDVKLRAAS
jgi:aryl-alcohol dehydrogenase-like predicted oxidoreductase